MPRITLQSFPPQLILNNSSQSLMGRLLDSYYKNLSIIRTASKNNFTATSREIQVDHQTGIFQLKASCFTARVAFLQLKIYQTKLNPL